MNLANKITIARICMIPVFLIVLLGGFLNPSMSRIVATIIFAIAASTDALDGYIARSRNMITNFGKFMDPIADKLLVSAALIAMIELGDLSAVVVVIMISREFIISGFRLIASDNDIVIAASGGGKLKTVSQMLMIIFILSGLNQINDITKFIGIALIWASVVISVATCIEYIVKNINVLKE